MTPTRRLIRQRMLILAQKLGPQQRVLEVGIAGDRPPGANREWFQAEVYDTLDRDESLKADHVRDLEDPDAPLGLYAYNLVLCSQVLEHSWRPGVVVSNLWRLTGHGGHCIVDAPFLYPPHADARDGDWWRMTPACLERLCTEAGFTIVQTEVDPEWLLVTVLARKGLADDR